LQLTCGICFERYSSDMMSSAACAHFYCHECWQGLLLPISRFPLYFPCMLAWFGVQEWGTISLYISQIPILFYIIVYCSIIV
jgi:hypothetical protein